ncbi:hypothetical protein ACIBEJ_03865 [Nonomuraea sp. NPDC050790]|uniref:hypothetical protein n=1 Tax=Nonomuraea sp. NPDC050790 TaxID=3364371 RepID=UPI00379197EB
MRPEVAPAVLAAALAAAPARVMKRLDAAPGAAESWQWRPEGGELHVCTGQETVRLPREGILTDLAQITCTCLLTPRCLHTLAVLSALPVAAPPGPFAGPGDTPAAPSSTPAPNPTPTHPRATPTAPCAMPTGAGDRPAGPSDAVGSDQARSEGEGPEARGPGAAGAVGTAWEAGAEVLATGVAHAGAAARERLLRAAHACAEDRQPTLARLATAVAQGVHDVAAKRPEFELARYAEDLAELLRTAWRADDGPAAHDDGPAARAGGLSAQPGRRRYEPLPPLILQGLFTEPVVTASGYAGVVTWLADDAGRLFSVADVVPGGAQRTAAAYRTAVRFGGLAISPERLGRTSVFAQNAAAGDDGRLSSTKDTKAAIHGESAWTADLWTEPPAAQLERALRGERGGLMFLDAELEGRELRTAAEPEGRDLRAAALTLTATGATPTAEANLRKLGGNGPRRVIVRVAREHPGVVTILAADQRDLSFADLPGPAGEPLPPRPARPATPLTPLRRVLHRVAMGGRGTAGPTAAATLAVTAARLRRDGLPTAAVLLENLSRRAAAVRRTVTGESLPEPPGELARAWTAAMAYAERADEDLTLRLWQART